MTNIIHWTQLTGNNLSTKFHPSMLLADGYVKPSTATGSRRTKETVKCYAHFDKSYVIEILKKQIVQLEIDQDEAIDLIGDVFEALEKERSEQHDTN